MKTKTALLSTAIGSLLALSLTSVSAYAADNADVEKCRHRTSRQERLCRPRACLCRTIQGNLRQGMDQTPQRHLRAHRRWKPVR